MRARFHAVAGWIAAVAVVSPPQTEPGDCAAATEHYKGTVSAITDALRKYEACVTASNGKDHCGAEMQSVDSAHDDFDDAVSDIEKYCTKK